MDTQNEQQEFFTHSDEYIICPHCGYAELYGDYEYYEDDETTQCARCEKSFIVSVLTSYSTRKAE